MKRTLCAVFLAVLFVVSPSATDFKLHVIGHIGEFVGSPAFVAVTMDASTDQVEWILQAREAITITTILLRYDLRTGTPPTFTVSIQGVDGSGNPDGTIKGGGSPASVMFTPPADTTWNGTIRRLTLDNSHTTTRGEYFAIVVSYMTGTIDASNKSTFTARIDASGEQVFPYSISNNAGVRTRSMLPPVIGYASATTTYGNLPIETMTLASFSSDGTPDEYALRFMLDSGYGATYTIPCVDMYGDPAAAGKSVAVTLYSGTTVLQRVIYDADVVAFANQTYRRLRTCFTDTTLATLSFGTVYHIGFAPQETSAGFGLATFDMDAAGDLTALPGGTDFYLSTKTCSVGTLPCPSADAGAWTDVTTSRPLVSLVIKDWVEPAGGSSVKRVIGGGV